MTDNGALVAAVFGAILSCCIAHSAGRGQRTWAWGLLGPFGWIVAAIHSLPALPARGWSRRPCPACGASIEVWSADLKRGVLIWCADCGRNRTIRTGDE